MKTSNQIHVTVCVLILFTLLAHPSRARACSCEADITIPNNFAQHAAVFTGKVIRIVDNYFPIFSTLGTVMFKYGFPRYFFYEDEKRLGFSVFFNVLNAWKGLGKTFVEVNTGRGGGDCGYSFTINKEYLIYANHAYGIPDNYWVTSTCSRTIDISNATDEMKYLSTLPSLPLNFTIPIVLTEKDAILYGLPLMLVGVTIFVQRRRSISKEIS